MLRTLMAAIALVALLPLQAMATPAANDPVLGRWLTQTKAAHIEIKPCGVTVCGTVVWLADEKDGRVILDTRNKDPGKRGTRIVGAPMLWDFKPAQHGWTNGRIYNAEDGGTYRATLKPQQNGTLVVEGCVGPLCRAQTWTRIH